MPFAMRAVRLLPVLLAAALASTALAATSADPVVIEIRDYRFEPAELTVPVGTTVRWENRERRQYHSIYFEGVDGSREDYFFPGETRERTFDTPGIYPYICEPHDASHAMRGVIRVVEEPQRTP
jgi:plastocyanin